MSVNNSWLLALGLALLMGCQQEVPTGSSRDNLLNLDPSSLERQAKLPQFAQTIPLADLNTPGQPLRGIVDMHTHPMSHLSMGGTVFHGAPDVGSLMPAGQTGCNQPAKVATTAAEALSSCEITHALENECGNGIRVAVIAIMEDGEGAQSIHGSTTGWPNLVGWPAANDMTHQIMWVDWMERSYRYGLRVMVALAHNNRTLATVTSGTTSRDDFNSAQQQLTKIQEFVARHDFMEIARTPEELRSIVEQDKLAVVLGVEVDDLGSTQSEIATTVDTYYNLGARYIFPVHLTDNRIGGTAVYSDVFQVANRHQNGAWWDLVCGPPDITFQSRYDPELAVASVALLGIFDAPPPPPPECTETGGQVNNRGLDPLYGEVAIRHMMGKGMMIDIDHMSIATVGPVLDLAERYDYPLNSGHSALRYRSGHEAARSETDYSRIAALGGMAGVGWMGADAADYALRLREVSAYGVAVALGTDANSLVTRPPAPNPGAVRLARWYYPTDGVAHYGLIPEYLNDVSASGGQAEVSQLFNSAEAFAQMWEKTIARSSSVAPGPSSNDCSSSAECASGFQCVGGTCWDLTTCTTNNNCPVGYVCESENGASCTNTTSCACVPSGGSSTQPQPDPEPDPDADPESCTSNADCGGTLWCLNTGYCGSFPETCFLTKLCPKDYSCINQYCEYAGDGPLR